MPQPTKSFFEQDHRKHYRWPTGNNRNSYNTGSIDVPAKPPLPASFKTRTKLKVFAYTGKTPDCASMLTTGNKFVKRTTSAKQEDKRTSPSTKENRKISLPHANTFPSTPSDRLTLDELMGGIDESKLRKPVEESPEEILGWNPNSSNPNTTPGRKRKRAQSSSPGVPSASAERRTGLGIQHIHKTPIADPAAELWQRYGGAKDAQLPDITFAMQATPRAVETPIKSAGLKRWASAGNEWPMKSKRQRLSTTKVWQDKPKDSSKMIALLDKLDESFAGQRLARQRDDPSSSSPLPQAGPTFSPAKQQAHQQHVPVRKSPLKTATRAIVATATGSPTRLRPQPSRTSQPGAIFDAADLEELAMDINSDEFEDDDIDLDAMAAIVVEDEVKAAAPSATVQAADLAVFETDFDDANGDDEFGLGDMDDQSLLQAEMQATQAHNAKSRRNENHESPRNIPRVRSTNLTSSASPQQARYRRFRVRNIVDCTSRSQERVLAVEDTTSSAACTVTLRGTWTDTTIVKHQIIHVAHAPGTGQPPITTNDIYIDDSEISPLLIVHPDHLLSATAVADSFDCTRKAVLFDRIKATSNASKWTVYGTILHEIFQQALTANTWSEAVLRKLVRTTVQAHLEGLWAISMRDENAAVEEVSARMTELAAWADIFVRSTPSISAKVKLAKDESLRIAISGLVAIEEHVWSPMYGLKGNVDATVQIEYSGKQSKTVVTPFEVKTGRTTNAPAHHAQTALYTLLMSDRYDIAVRAGILYYLESSDISWVAPTTHVVRQMVQQRNALASAIHHASKPPQDFEQHTVQLPDMAMNAQKCGRCYAQQSCFTFHALAEAGNADTAGMIDDSRKNHSAVWDEALGHLLNDENPAKRQRTKSWFTKWDRLLTFEEGETSRPTKELWTMSSTEREAAGRCFGKLVIRTDHMATSSAAGTIDGIGGSGGRINRFMYTLERGQGSTGAPFNDGSQLVAGEAIVVSGENGQWALAKGYVVAVTSDSVVVGVDRKLGDARQRLEDFDAENNQAFKGIMKLSTKPKPTTEHTTLYRIDKDEFTNGLALIRNNLVNIMSSHPNHTRLREMIVHGQEPVFNKTQHKLTLPQSQLGKMNEDQMAAVDKVMSAQDYALILGMPGTGKTTTIAHLIRALLADDKTILLTSYTHTAVDNILLKIRDIAPEGSILRIGVASKVNAQVQQFCRLAATPKTSFEELEQDYMQTRIVATTCLGINHAVFSRRTFDVCIVDEASQITMPTSLGPLLFARKFVLVGDHYQLSPLVQDREALKGGLDMSLFRLLSEKHPEAVAELGKQYRMCEDIMRISNELVYDGRLRCGNDAVAGRTIKYSTPKELSRFHKHSTCNFNDCWLEKVTNPNLKVVFADTDKIGNDARECLINSGKKITNRLEAVLTAQLVLALQAQGVAAHDIGVIALYRSQISLIRQLFGAAAITSAVEFDSADRFQGRDKECIIISMVRSNDSGLIGDLINDWRRLNVAFTRARSKLIVIGSRSTLVNNERMAKFLQLVDRHAQSLQLPADAETSHGAALDFVSQATHLVSPAVLPPSPKVSRTPAKSASQRQPLQALSGQAINTRRAGKVISGRESWTAQKRRMTTRVTEELRSQEWEDDEVDV